MGVLEGLLSEETLAGRGRLCQAELRPLAFSMLAELVHHARGHLSAGQLQHTVHLFSRRAPARAPAGRATPARPCSLPGGGRWAVVACRPGASSTTARQTSNPCLFHTTCLTLPFAEQSRLAPAALNIRDGTARCRRAPGTAWPRRRPRGAAARAGTCRTSAWRRAWTSPASACCSTWWRCSCSAAARPRPPATTARCWPRSWPRSCPSWPRCAPSPRACWPRVRARRAPPRQPRRTSDARGPLA